MTSKLQAKSPTLLQREYPALKHMKFNTFFCWYLNSVCDFQKENHALGYGF
jgi:hypothetical protein